MPGGGLLTGMALVFQARVQKAMFCWVLATTLHLPVPVIDGDTLSSTLPTPAARTDTNECLVTACWDWVWNRCRFEIQLIGCAPLDAPDGLPDGEIDGGVFLAGLFPLFLPVQASGSDLKARPLLTAACVAWAGAPSLTELAPQPATLLRSSLNADSWALRMTDIAVIQC